MDMPGPSGTRVRQAASGSESGVTWALRVLLPQLAHYYATRPVNPYPKLGAKSGGGHGRAALW